ncbi:MAG: hypothetical protein A3H51_01160 [Candidatus Spechtbacteria bacterium RIFCSPLOWO2_02_FULL_38_8]|uniref:Uncharacterized protein n=1 Tax=Candidatus Spechtbacteria bacterium RIFCSPLOWO2_02_FULL_38_8 TaxID=1802164 RepID=A0A1G2HI62_9BACT|nr:MAG: hypothetical protein A3H51_01160 [Candidatus Spechtbacteria bacterium RIFCSPLOWO2_02_FULL_38_8]
MKSTKVILTLGLLSLSGSILAGNICIKNQMAKGGYKYLGALFTGNTLPSVFDTSFCTTNQNGLAQTIYVCPTVTSTTKQCVYITTIQSTGTGNATFIVKGHKTVSSNFSNLKAYCKGAVKYQKNATVTTDLPTHDMPSCMS